MKNAAWSERGNPAYVLIASSRHIVLVGMRGQRRRRNMAYACILYIMIPPPPPPFAYVFCLLCFFFRQLTPPPPFSCLALGFLYAILSRNGMSAKSARGSPLYSTACCERDTSPSAKRDTDGCTCDLKSDASHRGWKPSPGRQYKTERGRGRGVYSVLR